jgi:hypothetical protein
VFCTELVYKKRGKVGTVFFHLRCFLSDLTILMANYELTFPYLWSWRRERDSELRIAHNPQPTEVEPRSELNFALFAIRTHRNLPSYGRLTLVPSRFKQFILLGERLEEREGFEPSMPLSRHTRFPSVLVRPLRHLSKKVSQLSYGRDLFSCRLLLRLLLQSQRYGFLLVFQKLLQ